MIIILKKVYQKRRSPIQWTIVELEMGVIFLGSMRVKYLFIKNVVGLKLVFSTDQPHTENQTRVMMTPERESSSCPKTDYP